MPPLFIPPLLKLTLGALAGIGAGAAVHWLTRRIDDEIDRVKSASQIDTARHALPTLRRDPRTGEWRLM